MDTLPIKTRKPATKDIDPAALRRLYHEEGMTIKGIAAQYGVSMPTVSKYLGPVRKAPRLKATKKATVPQAAVAKQEPVPMKQSLPKQLVQSKIEFKGRTATFEVDLEAGSLYARGAAFEMLLAREDVEPFIMELAEAFGVMARCAEPIATGAGPIEV